MKNQGEEKHNDSDKEKLKSKLELVSFICAPISLAIEAASLVLAFCLDNIVVRTIVLSLTILCGCGIIFFVIFKGLNANKAKKYFEDYYFENTFEIAGKIHDHYHNLRNYIVATEPSAKESQEHVKLVSQEICNTLVEFYRSLFLNYLGGYNVSVCIKLLNTEDLSEENYNQWRLETLSRSTSTKQERRRIDKKEIKVSENSDFQIILSDKFENTVFACPDMKKIKSEFVDSYNMIYENSRKDFLKYYRSAIVVPIKIDGENASRRFLEEFPSLSDKKIVLGFLCIDSLKPFISEREEKIFNIGVEFATGFADSLYVYLEKVMISRIEQLVTERNNEQTAEQTSEQLCELNAKQIQIQC